MNKRCVLKTIHLCGTENYITINRNILDVCVTRFKNISKKHLKVVPNPSKRSFKVVSSKWDTILIQHIIKISWRSNNGRNTNINLNLTFTMMILKQKFVLERTDEQTNGRTYSKTDDPKTQGLWIARSHIIAIYVQIQQNKVKF